MDHRARWNRGISRWSSAGIAAAVLLGIASGAAAQTGSISGRIVDSQRNPIPYVSVLVRGTQLGGRANVDGSYTIARVPVGTYTLTTRMVGYASGERADVSVDAGHTTVVDFQLEEKPVTMRTTVIKADLKRLITTTSEARHIETVETLHSLPIQELKDAIALKAGVISQGGQLHFRGGRGDEVLTIVDGIASRNPLEAQGVDLGLLAVSESEQVLGGLEAQYGNALSGIIRYTTREGGDKLEGEARYFTDRYGEADKSFDNYERLSVGMGGPFALSRTHYFVSFEGTYSDNYLRSVASHREHRFLDFIRLGNRQSNSAKLSSKLTFTPTPNSKLNFELLRNRSTISDFHNRWNRNGYVQVFQDSTPPSDGTVTQRYGTWAWYPVDSTYVPMNTANHLPVTDQDYTQTAVTWRQTFGSGKTPAVYNIRLSRQQWKSTTDVLDREPWEYQQQPNNYYDPLNRVEGPYYATNGDYPFFERKNTTTYTLNADYARTIGRPKEEKGHPHNLMMGGDINYNDLGFLRTDFPNVITSEGLYGSDRDEFRYFNPEGSFFVQDRWEYEGMVLNAGVRYDNFSVGNQISSADVIDRVKTQVSPRIGIAYPISDRDVMSFNYGRLFQIPDRQHIYQGRLFSAIVRGNPNLEPQTTIAYQLGVQHLFSDRIYGQFGVYFKDIYGWLTTVDQTIPGFAIAVPTYVNADYASSRGIEVTFIKRMSHGFSGEVNYTYSNTTGTASDPNRALPNAGNLRDQFKPTSEQPLDWDQRHSLSATLGIGDQRSWRASFVYQFGSGFPFTPHAREERRQNPELTNSRRLPSVQTLSMQGEILFRAWGQNMTLYTQGTNLLDADNIVVLQPDILPAGAVNAGAYNIYYTETGRAGGAFLVPDRDGDGREDWYPVHDPRVFQEGRTIKVGLGIQF